MEGCSRAVTYDGRTLRLNARNHVCRRDKHSFDVIAPIGLGLGVRSIYSDALAPLSSFHQFDPVAERIVDITAVEIRKRFVFSD